MTEHATLDAPDRLATEAATVIQTERAGLDALDRALQDPTGLGGAFARAVEILLHVSGRVVVTGIGKSGHVAGKFRPLSAPPAPPPCLSTLPRPHTGT